MGDMYDAVNPANIPADCDGKPVLHISVLADPAGECFDFETGNAGADAVAAACKTRHDEGRWSVGYVNQSNHGQLTLALEARGLEWASSAEWPQPGVYLWAADPDIAPGETPTWCPVPPVAVQNRDQGSVDISSVFGAFDAAAAGYIDGNVSKWPPQAWSRFTLLAPGPVPGAGPGTTQPEPGPPPEPAPAPAPPGPQPQPPTGGLVNVLVPQLQQGSIGASVAALQELLHGLAVDGVFGPLTEAAVRSYQAEHRLGVDGVVGVHTWGLLLGHPQ